MHTSQGPRTLLVAATGGHLEQLFRLSQRFEPASGEILWVTHDDAQSRSLLEGLQVETVPYVPPRGFAIAARQAGRSASIVRSFRPDRVVSTGAGMAVPFFLAARAHGVSTHYIESAARAEGPSLTGRIMRRLPGNELYCQYPGWAKGPWKFRGALFDRFSIEEGEERPVGRVVVTLGTMRTYEFHRLVRRLQEILPAVVGHEADIMWQTGATQVGELPGRSAPNYSSAELRSAIADADLVVAHAGIGSALTALELGKKPVLVPRRAAFDEHVDDHQELIAGELDRRGLAVSREADALTVSDLRTAARGRIISAPTVPPFVLATRR